MANNQLNILILGQGGRESAFAYKIAQSNKTNKLYIAPGNAGMSSYGTTIDVSSTDFEEIKKIVIGNNIDLVVVGPEDPLVKGIVDFFQNDALLKNVGIVGPTKEAAQLEGSKEFAKEFMTEFNIPTAKYRSFAKNEYTQACSFLDTLIPPYVLKADGLSAGKGVLILDNLKTAKKELKQMFDGMFGAAGDVVVIEEFLKGIECSVFVLVDDTGAYKILPVAKDYKRIGEGDTGLNTGGMGAVSPVKFANDEFMKKVEQRIVKPTVEGILKRGFSYKGFVFIGLMSVDAEPYVIEYNVRMGDPETEVVLPRVKSDIVELLESVAKGKLQSVNLEIDPRYATTVMMVAGGYPEKYEKGDVITGVDKITDSIVFQAGAKFNQQQQLVTNGGRVLAVTSLADNLQQALNKTYDSIKKIEFKNSYYRKDIGNDLK